MLDEDGDVVINAIWDPIGYLNRETQNLVHIGDGKEILKSYHLTQVIAKDDLEMLPEPKLDETGSAKD